MEGNERLGKAVEPVDYCRLPGGRREQGQRHWPSSLADGGAVLMKIQSSEGTQLVFDGYVPVTNWERQSLLETCCGFRGVVGGVTTPRLSL